MRPCREPFAGGERAFLAVRAHLSRARGGGGARRHPRRAGRGGRPTPFFTATFGSALCSAHWGREIYILEPAQDGPAQAALLAEIPEGHASIGAC